ncbi:hypothetical protein JB92DRAFT_784239 [Gautieria morchelliformis]|nr:hypothetical protein JB92DRAFT_784239 [Gautieria morchelliformis]
MNNPTYKMSNKLESMTPSFTSAGFHAFSGEPDSLTIAARNALFANLELPVSDISPHCRDPLVQGGHSDIWRTHLMRDGVRTRVALKVLRRNGRTQDEVKEVCAIRLYWCSTVYQEVGCWRVLDHANIAPLIGVCSNWHGGSPAIVSPWYDNGMASQYLCFCSSTRFCLETMAFFFPLPSGMGMVSGVYSDPVSDLDLYSTIF